jgi:hypothetical protein
MRWFIVVLTWGVLLAQDEGEVPVFGVSVVLSAGLTGQVYAVKPGIKKLPDFKKLKPIATIYTHALAIAPRDFKEGFPGLPDRLEWFAIDYSGRFWVETPGVYRFLLTSDDGSRLSIDGKRVVDNDGSHPPVTMGGVVTLSKGVHALRVEYFQGLRYHVALTLQVTPPDGPQRVFSTLEFKPPAEDYVPAP